MAVRLLNEETSVNTSTSRVDGCRVAALVALGLEFARSHGTDYARDLLQQMGADQRTLALFAKQVNGCGASQKSHILDSR